MTGFLKILFFLYYCVAKKYGFYTGDKFLENSPHPFPTNSLGQTGNEDVN